MEHGVWTGLSFWFYLAVIFCMILLIDNFYQRSKAEKKERMCNRLAKSVTDTLKMLNTRILDNKRLINLLKRCKHEMIEIDGEDARIRREIDAEIAYAKNKNSNEEDKDTKEEAGSGTTGQTGKGY